MNCRIAQNIFLNTLSVFLSLILSHSFSHSLSISLTHNHTQNIILTLIYPSSNSRSIYTYIHTRNRPDTSKKPIRTLYLGHVTSYQPIRDQYLVRFLIHISQALNSLLNRTSSFITTTLYISLITVS